MGTRVAWVAGMRRSLIVTSSLIGVTSLLGGLSGGVQAADGIKLRIGGYFNSAYQVLVDDDEGGEGGEDRNTDGIFSDSEIDFDGSTVLDNGLEVGAHITLVGETTDQQIDHAYVHFSDGWGELRFGSDDEALANMCVTPPGGSSNFSAFSPNQWAANTVSPLESNPVCEGVDDEGNAQKLVYYTPVFEGFQLGLSYTPSGGRKSQDDGVGPHLGMPGHGFDEDGDGIIDETESRHNVSAYATYFHEADDWEITWGGGGAWTGRMESIPGNADAHRRFYQTGFELEIDDIGIGAAFQYFDNYEFVSGVDGFVVGGGVAYDLEPWVVGLQYSYSNLDISAEDPDDDTRFRDSGDDFSMSRVVLVAEYVFGPGISIDGELGYTWTDSDGNDDLAEAEDYDAFEFGIGTAIEF